MTDTKGTLSPEDVEFFHEEGYLVLENFIEPDHNKRLCTDVDTLMSDRKNSEGRHLVTYPELGQLTSHPPMMDKIESIMDGQFAMHHIHAVRQDVGNPGVPWHQDYEQVPQTNRSHVMVHVFYYLNGLNGEVGDLLFVPRSQNCVVPNNGLRFLGYEDIPGTVCVDNIPPGSAIIVHSALWHARRPKPGGENHSRYFIDISYCQNGILWPGYGAQKDINTAALGAGLDRDGRYAHVYDSSQFFNRGEQQKKLEGHNAGSLALQIEDI